MSTAWKWHTFLGSKTQRRLLHRDMPILVHVIGLTPGRSVVVQAGGNIGLFPKRLAQDFARVITFEPDAENFAMLRHNAPEPNIEAHPCAVGADDAPVGLCKERRDGKAYSHEGLVHVTGPGDVPCRTIDSLCLEVCDLIYLDIEGHELHALRGAEQTIRRCRPVLALEINKSLGFVGLTPEDVRGFVRGLGYRFVERLRSDEIFVPEERAA